MTEKKSTGGANDRREQGRIDEIQQDLYSRDFSEKEIIGHIPKKDYNVQEDWDAPSPELGLRPETSFAKSRSEKKAARNLPWKKILAGSAAFFVVAAVAAAVNFITGGVFSTDKVSISVNGPVSTAGGEELAFTVRITNNNETPIETADLSISYPEGAYSASDSEESLPRTRITIGSIGAGETINEQIRVILFGEQNSEKEIRFTLEFRFENSNATLEKEYAYRVGITSSPIDLSLEVLDEITANQKTTFVVRVRSNSQKPIEDILLEMDYPFGFVLSDANPPPSVGEATWSLGDLAPGGERVIRLRGEVRGQHNEEKAFKAYVGSESAHNRNTIGTIYSSTEKTAVVKRPFLILDVVIDGERLPGYVFSSENDVRADVLWESTLPTKIIDAEIKVALAGEALDKFSVAAADGGFYQSINNTITWNKREHAKLATIEPGAQGRVSFNFASLPLYMQNGDLIRNPHIVLEVSARGRRISDTNVPEEINTSISKTVKFETDMRLAPRIVYYAGPFENTGPIPPIAERETTYTAILTVTQFFKPREKCPRKNRASHVC